MRAFIPCKQEIHECLKRHKIKVSKAYDDTRPYNQDKL